jgi:hypothetical protein
MRFSRSPTTEPGCSPGDQTGDATPLAAGADQRLRVVGSVGTRERLLDAPHPGVTRTERVSPMLAPLVGRGTAR